MRTQDLVSRGCIEYVDCEEEETTMIAMEIKDLDRATDGHIAYSNTCVQSAIIIMEVYKSCLLTVQPACATSWKHALTATQDHLATSSAC